MKLVECVPNFSEGRNRSTLDAIAAAVSSVEGIRLLDVDPGAATHRTVFTFVGPLDAVERAAFLAIEKAAALIDMRTHRGEHPRLGATDVCPFVPLGDTSMQECVEMAHRVAKRVGEELGIPVYLYEEAATRPERRSLSGIRKGEYEGLASRMKDPAWRPDYGPASFNARAGATVVGAREFLIAYNVNLNTRDKRLATRIAQNIRETGRPKRASDGSIVRDAEGRMVTEPGPSMLPATRATGWYIEEYGRAQVSINLTNYRVTPPHRVFEAVETEAAKLGVRVTGSEVVGLIPLDALLMAGRHFLHRQGKSPSAPESELIRVAVISLGATELAPFDPSKKIVERCVAEPPRLASMTLSAFCEEVSATSPAPGGGSVSALAGALSAGLSAMVSALTYEHRDHEARRDRLALLGAEAQGIRRRLLQAVDDDTRAFDALLHAGRMPGRTETERQAREEARRQATVRATEVPLSVMRDSLRALEIAGEVAEAGLPSALSDVGVAALAAAAALEGAWYNVRINLTGLMDAACGAPLAGEAADLMTRGDEARRRITPAIRRRIENG